MTPESFPLLGAKCEYVLKVAMRPFGDADYHALA